MSLLARACPLALVALATTTSAQLQVPGPTLVPVDGPVASYHVRYDRQTGEVTMLDGPAPSPATFTASFDNTLEPAGGAMALPLVGGERVVDWGAATTIGTQLVRQATFRYATDLIAPDVVLSLHRGYEGFGDQGDGFETLTTGIGQAPLIEIVLDPAPGDGVAPGDGMPQQVDVTVDIVPPLQLFDQSFDVALLERDFCFGWGYATLDGGVGPVLVDTQCVPSDLGPNVQGYEANSAPRAFDWDAVAEGQDLGFTSSTDADLVSVPDERFSFEGRRIEEVLVQANGAISLRPQFQEPTCSGESLECGPFLLGFTNQPCAVFAPLWGDYRTECFAPDPVIADVATSRVLVTHRQDRLVVTWENLVWDDPDAIPVTFQAHLVYCTNRVEFRYAQDVIPPGGIVSGDGDNGPQFASIGVFTQPVAGQATGFGGADLLISCLGQVLGQDYVVTRGELPVVNHVTNKLDLYELEDPCLATGTCFVGDFEILPFFFDGTFDLGPSPAVASTYLSMDIVDSCGTATIQPLPSSMGPPPAFMQVSGPPVLSTTQFASVFDEDGDGYTLAALATSPAVPSMPTPFGPLWVDLVMPGFLMVAPLGPLVPSALGDPDAMGAFFLIEIPDYDPVLCSQVYHLQGALFGGGLPPMLTRGFEVVLGDVAGDGAED